MFDLTDRPLVYIPVAWPGIVAGENDAAKAIEHRVEVQVELLDSAEVEAWFNESSNEPADPAERAAHNLKSFKVVAKGWRGVKAGTRTAEFTDANIAKMLLVPGFPNAFGQAYSKAMQGKTETRTGNSDGSPEHGPAGEPIGETKPETTSKS